MQIILYKNVTYPLLDLTLRTGNNFFTSPASEGLETNFSGEQPSSFLLFSLT